MPNALKIPMLLSGLAVFAMACDQVPTGEDPDGATPSYHHRPGHGGGGGGDGGGGGEPTYTLELSGAMIAGETPVEIGRDNNRNLHVGGTMEMSFAFDLTDAVCTLGLPDGYGGNDADLEALFVGVLTGTTGSPSTRDVLVAVNKRDATGAIRPLPLEEGGDDRWVSLGFNTGAPADVSGDFDGPGDRVLTYTGGNVRVVARLSSDTWEVCSSTVACNGGDPVADYVCPGWSESVVATLRESP